MRKNPLYRKVRGSHLLMISCGHCKNDIGKYQKKGRGNLLRMHIDRIVEASFELNKLLICPYCKETLGTMIHLRRKNKPVYKMIRSSFNTSEL